MIHLIFLLCLPTSLALQANQSEIDTDSYPRGHIVSALVHKIKFLSFGKFLLLLRKLIVTFIVQTPSLSNDNTLPVPCRQDNDLVIVIDESSSVTEPSFQIALQFAASLASAWRQHPANQVAVIFYSSTVRTLMTLPVGGALTPEDISNQILATTYNGGNTLTHLALIQAGIELQNNGRAQVPQNVVVLTDGISNNQVLTLSAAQNLYGSGQVRGFSVGIGNAVNEMELLVIAGNRQDRTFEIQGFTELQNFLRPLSRLICQS